MYYTIEIETRNVEGPFTFREACKRHRVNFFYEIETIVVKTVVGTDGKEVK